MGVHESCGQLTQAMKQLRHQWDVVKMSWDDSVSQGFEEKYLHSLQSDMQHAISAMDHMGVLLHKAQQDCK